MLAIEMSIHTHTRIYTGSLNLKIQEKTTTEKSKKKTELKRQMQYVDKQLKTFDDKLAKDHKPHNHLKSMRNSQSSAALLHEWKSVFSDVLTLVYVS